MKALVTGGAGFLGSHLCDRLIADGNDVLCVDNLYTGSLDNIRQLLGGTGFNFLNHDVTSPLDAEVERIFNLACPASPIHYQRNPIETTRTCVHGAINMLDLATRQRARILQASTSEVYGDPDIHPQSEDYWGRVNPIGPRSCYDEGKRCAETLFFDYRRQVGLDIKVARIFNTYGPRMHPQDGRVVSNFIVQALQGSPITIYGDGSQTRSFCYVDDLIDALVRFMNTPGDLTGPVNFGNPVEFDDDRTGRTRAAHRRRALSTCLRAAAAGRSETALSGHLACQGAARLEPESPARRRPEGNGGLFPRAASRRCKTDGPADRHCFDMPSRAERHTGVNRDAASISV